MFFYDVDTELVDAVASHLHAGLIDGEPVVAIVTAPHLAALDAALSARGLDVSGARATGSYLALDAAETLDSFMVDGTPDVDAFTRVLGGVLDGAPRVGSAVRAFGEMVAMLWHEGNVPGAIALESLWNDLAEHRHFSLLCAYPTTALGSADLSDVHRLCRLHFDVLTPSSYAPFSSGVEDDAATSGVFVAAPAAVAAARQFVTEALTSWDETHLVWEGALIVSELATNAIVHGGSPFRASVRRVGTVVRIAVEDVGPGLPQHRTVRHDALGGRGLAIVEDLALRWGCDRHDGGKVLWAELDAASA
ncbi:MAG: MEDS domain-containing protein [Nocardioides sp.]